MTLTELDNDAPGDNLACDLGTVRLVDPVSGAARHDRDGAARGHVAGRRLGQVRFTPVAGFQGVAHLRYSVTNTAGQSVTARP